VEASGIDVGTGS